MSAVKPPFPVLQIGHPLAQGVVGDWPFYEGSGLTINDVSGRGASPTLTGSPTPSWAGDQFGWALSFQGASSALINAFACPFSSNVLSISLWVRPGSATGYQGLFSSYTSDSDSMEIFLHSEDGTGCIGGGNYSSWARAPAGTITASAWHHIVLTSTGSVTQIYCNGRPVGTTGTTNYSTFASTTISCRRTGSFGFALGGGGLMDSVCAYNRALSANEVASLYADPFGRFRKRSWILSPTVTTTSIIHELKSSGVSGSSRWELKP